MTRSNPPARERGIAILSVITVLVALLIIAIPFVIAMKLARERTETSAARNRARFEAELISRAVASYIHRTHPAYEQQRRASSRGGVDADETVDSISEFTPPASYRDVIAAEAARDGGPTPSYSDPRGSIWSWKVTDVNGLVNPNGASPLLVANLMASATLSSEIDASATAITVDNLAPVFAPGGATFKKAGGWIRIGGEVIKYATFDSMMGFQGCERGAMRADAPLKDNGPAMIHKKGEIVLDYVAYKIATHIVASKVGSMTPFQNLEQMRLVHLWGGGGVLDADRFEAILPYMTVWSRRETAETFLDGQKIVNPLPQEARDGSGEILEFVEKDKDKDAKGGKRDNVGGSAAYFNPGTIALVTDGQQYDYVVVGHAGDEKGTQIGGFLTLDSRFPEGRVYEGGRAVIRPLAPFPIDINTASREVLAAVMTHLRLRLVDDPKFVVGPAVAWDLAGRIVESRGGPILTEGGDLDKRKSGPFRHYRDVDEFLDALQKGGVIGAKQREAVTRNAINPHDNGLAWGTAPFCYRTMDVYSIESRSVVNDAAGTKVAEAALRQIVEIGADKSTVWALDSQADFEVGLAMGSGGKFIETHPFNVGFISDEDAHVQPRRRGPMAVMGRYPSSVRDIDLGDVRLQAARIKNPGNPVLQEHADTSYYADGIYLPEHGPYRKGVKETLRKDDANDPYIHPFTIALWMRSYSEGNFWVFDTGKENDQNRISLFVKDGEQGRELVFRVCDSTMQGTGAELYVPLTRIGYQPETWFHLQANARGADPAQMELLIDGVSVGRRRGLTHLASGTTTTSDALVVESTEGFEPVGAVQVGTEVIEYDEAVGENFSKLHRAMRGTKAADWPEGTPVKRIGYSHPLLIDLRRGGLGLEQKIWAPWGFMRVKAWTNESRARLTFTPTTGQPTTITFLGLKEDDTSQQQCTLEKGSNPNGTTVFEQMPEQEQLDTFNSQGYAIMASPEFTPGNGWTLDVQKVGGWEVVWYTRQGATLTIDRYQSTAWHQNAGTKFFAPTKLDPPTVDALNAGKVKTYIAPISFLGKQAGGGISPDYLDPGHSPEDRLILSRYPDDGDPDVQGLDSAAWPRVVVGTKNTTELAGAVECIRYDSLDKQKAAGFTTFLRDEEASLKRLKGALIPFSLGAPPSNPPTTAGPTPPLPATSMAAPATAPAVLVAATVSAAVPLRAPMRSAVIAAVGTTDDDPPPADGGDGSPPPTAPGGTGPGAGREPPPDNSGGGGTEPAPGTGPGGNQPPPGVRPPSAPPTGDGGSGTGGGGTGGTGNTGGGVVLVADAPFDPPRITTLATQYPFRGVNDTLGADSTPGLKHTAISPDDADGMILPCFRILRRDPITLQRVGGFPPGALDVVTLATGVQPPIRREQKRVRWAHSLSGGRSSNWLALSQFLETQPFVPEDPVEILADYRGKTRLMKFPSGELPDEHGQDLVFGKNEVGGGGVVTAFIDEMVVWRHGQGQPLGEVINRQNLTDKDTEVTLRAVMPATTLQGIDGYDKDCGVIDLEGELIIYRGTHSDSDSITFERCARGTLGTKARPHATHVYARLVPDVWVSYLMGTLSRDSASIPVGRTSGWPHEGLVRILSDDAAELVHYTSRNDTTLNLPESLDADESSRGRGLLRGRYGTELQTHDNDELVLWQPFRYWDRYIPRRSRDRTTFAGVHDHPDGSYVEFAKTVFQAQWRKLAWVENLDGKRQIDTSQHRDRNRSGQERTAARKMDILVLVRFDQGVPWDEPTKILDMRGNRGQVPTDAKDHPERYLYLFDDPEAANRLDVEADTAEFRVYFQYMLQSFTPQDLVRDTKNRDDLVFENTWKQTPWLREFHVEYINRTKERYSADIR